MAVGDSLTDAAVTTGNDQSDATEESGIFGSYYYAHDCGTPYERNEHWREFFGEIAETVVRELAPTTVLDAGCAIGLLVEALRERGVDAYGVDVQACAIAAGEGVVWVAGCPFVDRLSTDAGPLRRLRHVFIPYPSPLTAENDRVQFRALALGGGSLWVLGDALDRRLWQLDPRSGAIRSTTRLDFPPRSLVYAAGRVWITDPLDDQVVALDARTHAVAARIGVCRGAA